MFSYKEGLLSSQTEVPDKIKITKNKILQKL